MNQSEEEIVKKLKAGEQQAFSTVVGLYQDMVYNTAISIVQNDADAEDITQEVFIQVHQSVESFSLKLVLFLHRLGVAHQGVREVERRGGHHG